MSMPSGGHIYLYAVIPGTEERELGVKGLYDSSVYAITEGKVTAVVSRIPEVDRLRPERRHLAAHQQVLSYLVENGGVVLPVSFGTVADNEKGIRDMLSKYQSEFLDQIDKVSGKVEMELRVVYDVPNVFEYYINKYPELKEMRDRLYAPGREPSREEKIDLGQLFEKLEDQEREEMLEKVLNSLKPCVEFKQDKPRNEKEVLRISCLLEKTGAEEFQSEVREISEMFEDDLAFEFNGPVPPYNFVDVRVSV